MTAPTTDTDRLAEIRANAEHQLMLDRSIDTIAARDHAAAVDDRAFLLSLVDSLQERLDTAASFHQPSEFSIFGRRFCKTCDRNGGEWPCAEAKALELAEAQPTVAPDSAMDPFEAADDIYRRWE